MTDITTATDEPVFDTSTAAGRLRILWGATADPELAMSDDEVADVPTVLREHAEMAAELERLRAERGEAAPVMPDPRGPEHQRVVTDWHTIEVEGFKSQTPDGSEWFVEYDVDHPAECDRLPYGEQCLVDRVLALFGDDGQLGAATRRARAHVYGPDQNGDFEEWIEWGNEVEQ